MSFLPWAECRCSQTLFWQTSPWWLWSPRRRRPSWPRCCETCQFGSSDQTTLTCCCCHVHTCSYSSNHDAGISGVCEKVCISIPVHEDDTHDEKSHSDGKKVCQRHIVRVPLRRALQCGVIGQGDVVMSNIILAALLQCVVSVVPIIHHSFCKIALQQKEK